MFGSDGKLFKIWSGGIVKLVELLDEVVECVCKLLVERDIGLIVDEFNDVVCKVGIGVVKYVDLSKNCIMDYVFNWDIMLSFEGNIVFYL